MGLCRDCHDPWDMACPPELIVSDGGSAFIAPEFKMACADLGIATEIAVEDCPSFGPSSSESSEPSTCACFRC